MFVIWNNNEQWFQLGVLFLLFLLLVERATKFIHYFYIFIFIRIKLQLFSLVCGASKRTSESGIRLQVLFWLCKKYASMISNKHRCRYRKNTMTLSVSTTKIWKNKIRNKFSFLDGVHFFFVAHRIHQCTSTTHQIWNAKNNNESLSDFQGLFIRLKDGFISSIKHSLSSKKKMIPLSLPMYRKFLSIHFVPTHNGCLILTRLFAQQSWSKETH